MNWLIDGAYAFLFGWVDMVPFGWYGITFIAGAIVGAWLGKPTVAGILAVLGVLMFWRRNAPDPIEHVGDEDPPRPRRTVKAKPKVRTFDLRDMFKGLGK